MYLYIYIYIYMYGKSDSIHHHLLEVISETANVLELRQTASIHHPLWMVVVYGIGLPNNN